METAEAALSPIACHITGRKEAAAMLHERGQFDHKGTYGHGLLIAGCREMCGAAVLSARGALKSGIGLLDVLVPPCSYGIVQGAVPEAMVRQGLDASYFEGTDGLNMEKYTAVAIGPALGQGEKQTLGLKKLLSTANIRTLILDADALNLLSNHPDLWSMLPKPCILTPHPGEFERLYQSLYNSPASHFDEPVEALLDRVRRGITLAREQQVHLIIKGALTAVITPTGECFFNTTGNPGMATGGSGDVLTGILLSLSCQSYPPTECCRLGVYLHGASADQAVAADESVESLTANSLTTHLGLAFKSLSSNL